MVFMYNFISFWGHIYGTEYKNYVSTFLTLGCIMEMIWGTISFNSDTNVVNNDLFVSLIDNEKVIKLSILVSEMMVFVLKQKGTMSQVTLFIYIFVW